MTRELIKIFQTEDSPIMLSKVNFIVDFGTKGAPLTADEIDKTLYTLTDADKDFSEIEPGYYVYLKYGREYFGMVVIEWKMVKILSVETHVLHLESFEDESYTDDYCIGSTSSQSWHFYGVNMPCKIKRIFVTGDGVLVDDVIVTVNNARVNYLDHFDIECSETNTVKIENINEDDALQIYLVFAELTLGVYQY